MAATELGTKAVHIASQENMLAMDIQGSALAATAVSIGSVAVRNTSANFVGTNLDWSSYKTVTLRINNGCNQPITLTLQIQGIGDTKDITGATNSVTVPASTTEILLTPKDWPVLGYPLAEKLALKATAATAPTSGSISVTAYVAPYI